MLGLVISLVAAIVAGLVTAAYLARDWARKGYRFGLTGWIIAAAAACGAGYAANSLWAWITYEPMQCYWQNDEMIGCLIGRQKIHNFECAFYDIDATKYGTCVR